MGKNQLAELTVTDMTSDGRGIGRVHGMLCGLKVDSVREAVIAANRNAIVNGMVNQEARQTLSKLNRTSVPLNLFLYR